MSHAVDSVEDKRPSNQELEATLDSHGKGTESGYQGGALEVKTGQRGDEVGDRVTVQQAGEAETRETLPDGGSEVGLLLVVNVEMGGNGTLQTLLGEDGVGVVWG